MDVRYTLAVVTGAGDGLGREIAVALARQGAALVVADRDRAAAERTVAEVLAARVRGWAVQADLADETDVRLLAARIHDLGGADILVNNAGGWTDGPEQLPHADAAGSRTLDLDLRSPALLTRLFLDGLEERRGRRQPGAVVNVAGSAALGSDDHASPEHAAAKASLVRFTNALGDAPTAARARVMAVVPGGIGRPRAHAHGASMGEEQRAEPSALVSPAAVARTVVDLVRCGRPGQVVELLGEPRTVR